MIHWLKIVKGVLELGPRRKMLLWALGKPLEKRRALNQRNGFPQGVSCYLILRVRGAIEF
jgi:hypothetical protein